jgi:hypothetical protein
MPPRATLSTAPKFKLRHYRRVMAKDKEAAIAAATEQFAVPRGTRSACSHSADPRDQCYPWQCLTDRAPFALRSHYWE